MKTILIVGQGPSKSGVGEKPLDGAGSGEKLAELAGVTLEQLHEKAECVNLFDVWYGKTGKGDTFPAKLAKEKADEIKPTFSNYKSVVLLGTNVAKAFGVYPVDMLVWNNMTPPFLAVVPHPSGVNRWYNDPHNAEDARKFLTSLFSDRLVPVEGTAITKTERAKECTEKLQAYDRRSDWVELAVLLVECERERLFELVGCKTWDDWVRTHAPRSYRLCYMVKAQYKALEGNYTLDEMRRIPPETARWATKAKNLSPAVLGRPEVKAALMQPRRKAVAALQESVPNEHVEDTHNLLCKFAASQYNAISEAHEAYKMLVDEHASMEDFLEHAAEEWFGSLIDESRTFRQMYHDYMSGEKSYDVEQSEEVQAQGQASAAIAAL